MASRVLVSSGLSFSTNILEGEICRTSPMDPYMMTMKSLSVSMVLFLILMVMRRCLRPVRMKVYLAEMMKSKD